MNFSDHRFRSRGLELHFIAWGAENLPVLVLLHGGRDHARSWDGIAAALCRQWRVVVPDLRGHGDSAWSPEGNYRKVDYVADLARLITEYAGQESVVLIGHSLGANIALHYASVFSENVKAVVAIEGLMASPEEEALRDSIPPPQRLRDDIVRAERAAERLPQHYADLDSAMRRLAKANPRLTPALLCHLAQTGTRRAVDGSLSWKHDPRIGPGPITDGPSSELAELLRAVRCPTLLVYGSESSASRPSRDGRLALLCDARELTVADAGHWVQHDQPETLLLELREFLSGQT